MLNNNFVASSFTDGLLYKPSDINALVESSIDETLKFLKVKLIVEKIEITNETIFEETLDALNMYKEKVIKTVKNENQKNSLLTEISNLVLGVLKFITPYIVKLVGWLTGMVVNTKTFGKAAITVSDAFKKLTPDMVKKAITFAKDNYQKADAAFQNIASTVNQKVQDAFKGTNEKPPLIDGNAIKKVQDNIIEKIKGWPIIGKVVKWGSKLGITSKGFYTFLAIVILSVFATFGSFGAGVILILYGANSAAQRVVSAGKEVGAKVADKTAQGIQKAKGETPQAASGADPFADLDNLINAKMGISGETPQEKAPQEQTTLSPELEDISGKWATKLKASIDKGEKDNAITKIKAATEHLVKSNGIKKEQVKPFISNVAKKANVADDIKDALLTAIGDLAVSF